MNKLSFWLLCASLISGVLHAADITFTFANSTLSGSTFEVDVMVQASESGTKLGDNQVYINYDTNAFGTNVVAGGNLTVTKGTMLEDGGSPLTNLYTIVNVADNTSARLAVTTLYNYDASPTFGNDLPTTPTQLLHLTFTIANSSYTAGLSFQQPLMVGQQYESDNSTAYANVIADDTDDSPLSPIVVDLVSFTARRQESGVLLSWTTASEIGQAGFNIYRRLASEKEFARVNKNIILSDPANSAAGAVYEFVDYPDRAGDVFYKLQSVDVDGSVSFSETISVTITTVEEQQTTPDRFALMPNFPNPFNPETRIEYVTPTNAFVRLAIYNLQGQKIRELVHEMKNAGVHTAIWNGVDDSGRFAGSGVYMLRMTAGDFQSSRWITLLR